MLNISLKCIIASTQFVVNLQVSFYLETKGKIRFCGKERGKENSFLWPGGEE